MSNHIHIIVAYDVLARTGGAGIVLESIHYKCSSAMDYADKDWWK